MTELNLSELLICSVLFGRMSLFDAGGSGTFACVVMWYKLLLLYKPLLGKDGYEDSSSQKQ